MTILRCANWLSRIFSHPTPRKEIEYSFTAVLLQVIRLSTDNSGSVRLNLILQVTPERERNYVTEMMLNVTQEESEGFVAGRLIYVIRHSDRKDNMVCWSWNPVEEVHREQQF